MYIFSNCQKYRNNSLFASRIACCQTIYKLAEISKNKDTPLYSPPYYPKRHSFKIKHYLVKALFRKNSHYFLEKNFLLFFIKKIISTKTTVAIPNPVEPPKKILPIAERIRIPNTVFTTLDIICLPLHLFVSKSFCLTI